jgi:hypothetical protein
MGDRLRGLWRSETPVGIDYVIVAFPALADVGTITAIESHEEARERLLALWSEGLTLKQIAERVSGNAYVTPYRKF